MNRIKVIICGKEYILQTEEENIYVYTLAKKLEQKISNLINGNSSVSIYNASIMVAMSTLDELQKTSTELDEVKTQINDYIDEASKTRMERDDALRENAELKNKLAQLESDLNLKQVKDSI